jgi:hypothetical protein
MADTQLVARRAVLQGALLAPLASCAAMPALGAVPEETPIQRLFAEWAALWSHFNTTGDRLTWTDQEWDDNYARLEPIEDLIEAEPATSLADLALKHAALTSLGAVVLGSDWDREVADFLAARET